jgi:predicted PurR-regulated permease PerM
MFVAIVGGLQAFGALGIVLGPVIFAAVAAIVDVVRDTVPRRSLPPDPTSEEHSFHLSPAAGEMPR